MKKHWFIAFALVAMLSLGLAACGGPQAVDRTVTLREFEFDPATITVPAGADVNLTLINDGTVEHEFVVIDQGVEMTAPVDEDALDASNNVYWEQELQPGTQETYDFPAPDEPGEYQVICAIAGHLEAGMEATLVVQ